MILYIHSFILVYQMRGGGGKKKTIGFNFVLYVSLYLDLVSCPLNKFF
jgi:hypothetical protein